MLQESIPELTHSLVGALDTVNQVIRPLGNVTEDLAGIVDDKKSSILPLQKMALGTVKLLDTMNAGLAPMQNMTLGVVDLVDTTNKTMMAATMALVLAGLALVITLVLVAMCGLYYSCYRNMNSQTKCCNKTDSC